MKLFPTEPHVNLYDEGFGDDDILGRKRVGERLSGLLERIEDPLVVALHGRWGMGKTYFLKRWVGAHTKWNEDANITVYFDAFAHDYLSDPLPALLSALDTRLPKGRKDKMSEVKQAAIKLAKPLFRPALALATSGVSEVVPVAGDGVAKAAESVADTYWESQQSRQTAMNKLRSSLKALAKPNDDQTEGSTVVFVIDELDRCRPDYALEVLEVVKHFFTVPRIHFVLGTNLEALENSVRARYGSDIDAAAYLRKFIHISMDLPDDVEDQHTTISTVEKYLLHCVKEMNIPKHLGEPLTSSPSLRMI